MLLWTGCQGGSQQSSMNLCHFLMREKIKSQMYKRIFCKLLYFHVWMNTFFHYGDFIWLQTDYTFWQVQLRDYILWQSLVLSYYCNYCIVSHLNWISKSRWSIGNQDIQMMRGKLATPGWEYLYQTLSIYVMHTLHVQQQQQQQQQAVLTTAIHSALSKNVSISLGVKKTKQKSCHRSLTYVLI